MNLKCMWLRYIAISLLDFGRKINHLLCLLQIRREKLRIFAKKVQFVVVFFLAMGDFHGQSG